MLGIVESELNFSHNERAEPCNTEGGEAVSDDLKKEGQRKGWQGELSDGFVL